jgi:DNA helicase II / ATP-dependent DNA helicase PcrA
VLAANIEAKGKDRDHGSLVSLDQETTHQAVDDEIVRLIRHNCEHLGIAAHEVCVVGPRWIQLAALTRRLMSALPEYSFDGPGMAPFSRDQENFWFKVARLALTEPSPQLYVRGRDGPEKSSPSCATPASLSAGYRIASCCDAATASKSTRTTV